MNIGKAEATHAAAPYGVTSFKSFLRMRSRVFSIFVDASSRRRRPAPVLASSLPASQPASWLLACWLELLSPRRSHLTHEQLSRKQYERMNKTRAVRFEIPQTTCRPPPPAPRRYETSFESTRRYVHATDQHSKFALCDTRCRWCCQIFLNRDRHRSSVLKYLLLGAQAFSRS